MSFIEDIKKNNQFPIIFIGSGITQRYFQNAPTWEQLIKSLWNLLFDEDDYYAKYHEFQEEDTDTFEIYTKLATYLESKINQAFFTKKLEIEGLTLKKAHEEKISPFRQLIANQILNLEQRSEMEAEIELFSNMIKKARIIITTNYDTFIEECFKKINTGIKVNVGNKGLFSKSSDYGELYKIHGSVTDVNSISFTEQDYIDNESKTSIVNAKILSNLTESPIIFLGYSLTDKNIQKLLVDFSQNSPFDIAQSASRIGVIEFSQGEESIVEYLSSIGEIGVHYTALQTDNYGEIYKQIAKIQQGFLPSEIAKFERAFRKIIEVKGEENELQTVIADYIDIADLSNEEIRNKQLVVAFGDNKYIYKFPDYQEYIHSYFKDGDELPIEIAFKFLAVQPKITPIPFGKYAEKIKNRIDQIPTEKESIKLKARIEYYEDKDFNFYRNDAYSKLNNTNKQRILGDKTPTQIYENSAEDFKERQKVFYILYHMKEFNSTDMRDFIMYLLENRKKSIYKTEYRRLFMAYSLL